MLTVIVKIRATGQFQTHLILPGDLGKFKESARVHGAKYLWAFESDEVAEILSYQAKQEVNKAGSYTTGRVVVITKDPSYANLLVRSMQAADLPNYEAEVRQKAGKIINVFSEEETNGFVIDCAVRFNEDYELGKIS
jgi:hypothetical protein